MQRVERRPTSLFTMARRLKPHRVVVFVITVCAAWPSSAETGSILRGPYLQMQGPDRVQVRWRTDPSVREGTVRYGTGVDERGQSVQARRLAGSTVNWGASLEGLHPNSKYYYSVHVKERILVGGDKWHFFYTAPPPGARQPIRFWVLGDAGINGYGRHHRLFGLQDRAADGFREYNDARRIDGILLLGDNAYPSGTDQQYQLGIFEPYRKELHSVPIWPCIGNHDTDHCYFQIFSMPIRGQIGGVASGSSEYYSFDYANVHFVVLSTWRTKFGSAGDPQIKWLRKDLESNRQDWTVVAFHHPPYCDGKYRSEDVGWAGSVRRSIVPVMEKHGVDLVLCGHDHTYQRSYLIDGHYGPSAGFNPTVHLKDQGNGSERPFRKTHGPHQGTVYVVSGTAGAPVPLKNVIRRFAHPAMIELAGGQGAGRGIGRLGTFLLEIDGLTLSGTQISEGGKSLDHFTIEKTRRGLQSGAPGEPQPQ